ncbi:hypothetical protein ACFY3G_51620 [Streptomyces phaeochromogenes]|uniref:hypothetical protein n=1 Tax=Streptomyces phaeochromogenes TaxID=1923 RepID=UPI0036AEB7C3
MTGGMEIAPNNIRLKPKRLTKRGILSETEQGLFTDDPVEQPESVLVLGDPFVGVDERVQAREEPVVLGETSAAPGLVSRKTLMARTDSDPWTVRSK